MRACCEAWNRGVTSMNGDLLEPHLAALDRAFVEDLRRDGLRARVDALLLRLVEDRGNRPISNSNASTSTRVAPRLRHSVMTSSTNNRADREVDRPDDDEPRAGSCRERTPLRRGFSARYAFRISSRNSCLRFASACLAASAEPP